MSTLSHKLVAVSLVAAFSMVMYGCGGGGGSSSVPDVPATMPDPTDPTDPEMPTEPEGPTDEELAAEAAAATKAAGTKRTAIQTENDQTTDAGIGGTLAEGVTESTYSMEISRDRDGTTVKIEDSALAGDDDPKFALAMDLGSGTTMHVREMEANDDGDVVEEVVIVTTDIEAPKATAFAKVAGQELNDYDLDPTVDADNDGEVDNDFTALTVATTAIALVKSSAFTANTDATLMFDFNVGTTASIDEADEVPGTYNGAMGTYRCNGGSACTVTIDDTDADTDGDQLGITAMSTGWVFIPDSGATSDVPDADHMHYGFWLQRTTDEDGVLTYDEVETYAESSIDRTTDADIAATGNIRGTATYSGGATGVYVNSVLNPNGTEASATSGHFTADAELTAHFNQTEDDADTPANEAGLIAPALLNSISGTIDNFMLSGHDQGPGWSVTLEQGAIDGTDPAAHATGTTKGGGADGNYEATFHGGGGDDNDQPTSVVGEFNAFFSNGSVAGGFGARKND